MATPVFRSTLEYNTPPPSPPKGQKERDRSHSFPGPPPPPQTIRYGPFNRFMTDPAATRDEPSARVRAATIIDPSSPAPDRHRRKSLPHPTINEHYHHFRELPVPCTCVLPAHVARKCAVPLCVRRECAVERQRIETIAPFQDPKPVSCIPEDTVTTPADQMRFGKEGRSCRFCSVDYWCWCEQCGNRLCAECTLREAESSIGRGLGVRHKGVETRWIWP